MKEILNANQVVARVNQLINNGKKIKVFVLPYPPYKDEFLFNY